MPSIEAVVNLISPLIINRDEGQGTFALGELGRDLLKGYQRPRSSAPAFMPDVLCPAIN